MVTEYISEWIFLTSFFYLSDPITYISIELTGPPIVYDDPNPCLSNPCGPNSVCRVHESQPVCSCVVNYIGRPPNCRPECTVNSECPSNKACINEKCRDPCVGACAFNAECHVHAHTPRCVCSVGYEGDPFSGCHKIVPSKTSINKICQVDDRTDLFVTILVKDEIPHPCNPSPCGANAICKERNGAGSCSCIPEYFGDPYVECRPECVMNSECPMNRACSNNKCVDPCPGLCGQRALCQVANHNPTCYCVDGHIGDPFVRCNPPPSKINQKWSDPRTHQLIPMVFVLKFVTTQSSILVYRLLVDHSVNAEQLTLMPFVLAYPITLEVLQIVDPNALSVRNVRLIGHASTWNVKIPVQELVACTLDVVWSITMLSAVAILDSWGIRL